MSETIHGMYTLVWCLRGSGQSKLTGVASAALIIAVMSRGFSEQAHAYVGKKT